MLLAPPPGLRGAMVIRLRPCVIMSTPTPWICTFPLLYEVMRKTCIPRTRVSSSTHYNEDPDVVVNRLQFTLLHLILIIDV